MRLCVHAWQSARVCVCAPVSVYLVADAVAGLVGVVVPVHLAVGVGLGQRRGLLGQLLGQGRGRGAGGQRGGRGRGGRLVVGRLGAASADGTRERDRERDREREGLEEREDGPLWIGPRCSEAPTGVFDSVA